MPVAWGLVRMVRRADAGDALTAWKLFLDLFELVTRTSACLALGGYLHAGAPDARSNRQVLACLDKRVSLGDWWALLLVDGHGHPEGGPHLYRRGDAHGGAQVGERDREAAALDPEHEPPGQDEPCDEARHHEHERHGKEQVAAHARPSLPSARTLSYSPNHRSINATTPGTSASSRSCWGSRPCRPSASSEVASPTLRPHQRTRASSRLK